MGDRELDQRIWNALKGRGRRRPPTSDTEVREVPAEIPNYSNDLQEALDLKDLIASKDQDRPGLWEKFIAEVPSYEASRAVTGTKTVDTWEKVPPMEIARAAAAALGV